ncbi:MULTISPECIES: hypothetical protein [unclassified Haloparvum]|uniref:hypothetical protein n=1 Tax=Haloparvum sp. PAK95 TaxID=3418962 RepID=UPI003D2F0621
MSDGPAGPGSRDDLPSHEPELREDVLSIVEHNQGYPASGIASIASDQGHEKSRIRDVLADLVERGKVVKEEGRYWPAEHLGEEE